MRLPQSVKPDLYHLTLDVAPQEGRFSGEVSIGIRLDKPLRRITLHALELKIEQARVKSQDRFIDAEVLSDPASETITLTLREEVPAGHASVEIAFSGRLGHLRGLYTAKGRLIDGTEEIYAFSHFEPTDARRMFPCFDEPELKAHFYLTAIVPKGLTAVSNMPAVSETELGEKKRVEFAETPIMSTYLLALAVARLESKERTIAGTNVRLMALPGQTALGDFALKVAGAALPMLNDYFGLRYPYPKLDLLSVPDFAMGAMENWGAIFFRDSALLLDESRASAQAQRRVANVITHEIVHQWFGNLVTMRWWDDLWLNESFATWLACKIVDQWRPQWNSWQEFQQEKQVPLAIDALDSTRPISAKVENPAEIEEMFDVLTYEKGAACLRMLERFLGEEVFRDGIRRYIRKHQFGNAAAEDLWSELEEVSGQPVKEIARDWFSQPGFPLISIRADGADRRMLVIEQRRFSAHGQERRGDDPTIWSVPLSLKFNNEKGTFLHRWVFKEKQLRVALPGDAPVRWVYGNAEESGFFRIETDPSLREALMAAATSELDPVERIGLLNHFWALAQAGDSSVGDFLDLLLRFKGHRNRIVVESIAGYLETLSDRVVTPEDRPLAARLIEAVLGPVWDELGWDPRPEENDEPRLTRAALFWALRGVARTKIVLADALARLERYLRDPGSLDPTLATPLVRVGALFGGEERFSEYRERFEKGATPEERDRFLLAMGFFPDRSLSRRLLEYSLSEKVRAQDVWKPARILLSRPEGQEEAWMFVREQWSALREKGGSVGALRIIQGFASLWREEWLAQVEAFFSDPKNRVPSAERALAQTLEFLRIGIRFKKTQQAALSRWLQGSF